MALDFIQPTIESSYNMTMSSVMKDHPSVKPTEWILGALHRCDSCNAEALVKVTGLNGELLFCGHHYNKIMDNKLGYEKMMSFMIEIVDEREKLVQNKLKDEDYV
jgi:hypothetical protein